MYKITVRDLYDKFDKYNEMFFNGCLPEVALRIDNTRKRLGCFHHNDRSISISKFWDRSEHDVDTTLIHEMIHLWQWEMFHDANHGKTFKTKANEIRYMSDNKFQITRCSSVYGNEASVGKPERIELLIYDWQGKTRYCRPCKGKGPVLYTWYKNAKGVSNMKRVTAYGDFQKLTRCSTRLHTDVINDIQAFYRDHDVREII